MLSVMKYESIVIDFTILLLFVRSCEMWKELQTKVAELLKAKPQKRELHQGRGGNYYQAAQTSG